MALKVKIHRTDTVDDSRIDTAKSALHNVDNVSGTIETEFTATEGHTNLNNSEYSFDDRAGWIRYCEDQLHNSGVLGDATLHVVLYERSFDASAGSGDKYVDGAGYANWTAGAKHDEDKMGTVVQNRKYSNEDGKYAFANVNVATGNWPYTKKIYKNTVVHELGHCLHAAHGHGAIHHKPNATGGGDGATPLATWYTQGGCGSHWPDRNMDVSCWDDSGESKACLMYRDVSDCTADRWKDHIGEFGSNIIETT